MNINDKILNDFQRLVNTSSDINEHLPTLLEYGTKCQHITELGMRWIVSTYAFVLAKPQKLISVDLHHPAKWDSINRGFKVSDRFKDIELYCKTNDITFEFKLGNTLEIELEETDLLFIDTFHVYKQLRKELELHANKSKKYIILHDTTLYGFKNEISGPEQFGLSNETIFSTIEDKEGLRLAVQEFLAANPHWSVEKVFENCNGLTILKRN